MHGSTQAPWKRLLTVAVAVVAAAGGCSRQHYRERADKDVEGVISQKNIFPDWKVENWHVYPDPRARFADPPNANPDFPHYPPDDYAAWVTAPNPQRPGRGGTGRYESTGYLCQIEAWDALNRAEDGADDRDKEKIDDKPKSTDATDPYAAVSGAAATGYLTTFATDVKPYRIKLEQAVELAIFNSREFQDRREDLYLVALPVTLERYGFAAQAFAAEQIIRESTGRDFPGGGGEAWRINTDAGIRRSLATGAELTVRLANQIVIDLSGPSPQTSLSNLTLTFIQPLLRGGGFAVTLEALTQAERTLLYAIRSYARFRKVFYVALAGQGDYTNNPYGLQGLAPNLGRGVGANLTSRATGYLPTVLLAARLANERKNVASLEGLLQLFRSLKEGGGVNELQIVRVEQNLIRSRTNVLNNTRLYLDNIDFFKQQLGVPATLQIELDDTPLRPVRRHLQRFDEVYAQMRELEVEAGKYNPADAPTTYRERWGRLLTNSSLARGTPFAQQYSTLAARLRMPTDDALAKQIAGLLERRRRLLDLQTARQAKSQPSTPEQTAELVAIDIEIDQLRFEQALRRYEARPWLNVLPERRAAEQVAAFRNAFEAGMLVAIQPRNERLVRLRAEWPQLPPMTVDGADLTKMSFDEANAKVAQAALINRLDLMNARAQVVDSWRQITVQANSLQGVFNVRYDLESTTPTDEAAGLAFAGTRSRHTVTMQVEPPFVRRAERNQYRASLIGYQRSRRNLMAFEDNIVTDARQDLRQLRQLAESYLLQQRSIELSYAQVDNALSTFLAPPDPAARDSAGNVAALTQQLLEAQNSLLQAQNDLYATWIGYQNFRMTLYLDLELLPLDARGLWIDEPLPTPPTDGPGGPPAGPALPGGAERAPAPQPVPGPGR
jgi:hypothetical protein